MPGCRWSFRAIKSSFRCCASIERSVRVVGPVIGARVLHGLAKHRDVQVVRQIVVPLRDSPRQCSTLRIADPADQDLRECRGGHESSFQPRRMDAREELVESRDVPPAVHVGFAGAEGSVRQHTRIESIVEHADVPRIAAVDFNVCGPQQGRQLVLCCHEYRPAIPRATATSRAITYPCGSGAQSAPAASATARCAGAGKNKAGPSSGPALLGDTDQRSPLPESCSPLPPPFPCFFAWPGGIPFLPCAAGGPCCSYCCRATGSLGW